VNKGESHIRQTIKLEEAFISKDVYNKGVLEVLNSYNGNFRHFKQAKGLISQYEKTWYKLSSLLLINQNYEKA
jgi:hypothetical protein